MASLRYFNFGYAGCVFVPATGTGVVYIVKQIKMIPGALTAFTK